MSESKKQAILIVVLLAAVLAATAVSRRTLRTGETRPAVTPAPMNYAELRRLPTTTVWYTADYPAIEDMRENILHTFHLCESQFQGLEGPISGMLPAREYGMIFVRDTSTMMPALRYFYGDEYLRTPVEEFLRRQYGPHTRSVDGHVPGAGAISAVISPQHHIDKATVVSDEEAHLINAAYVYYRTAGGPQWLRKELVGQTVIRRLNRALDWLYAHRFDSTRQLIKRGHTTDWGDIKLEASDEPTDLDPLTDNWTCSIYDQALTYRALLQLAEMNRAVGDRARARELQARAEQLRRSTNVNLWNSEGGFYRIHLHLTPLQHSFAEEDMISIGNALVSYVDLSGPAVSQQIFTNLERARLAAGAAKPGLSLYPPYPAGSFPHAQMSPGEYQNGGLWDWWGGTQITAEFENGCSSLALAHLRMVAQDWVRHPRRIFEWQSPRSGQGWGAENYASAAATMAEAIIRGLFGVTIEQDRVRLEPRLTKSEGRIRVLQPATGLYASYDYSYEPGFIVLDYGSNHVHPLEVRLLLPRGREIEEVSMDGYRIPHHTETLAEDSYCAFEGPSGVHRAVVTFKCP